VKQLVTAGASGVAATGIDLAALVAQVEAGIAVPRAAFVAAAVGAAVCFLLNKYLAFRDRSPLSMAQVARFAAVALGTALLLALAMHVVAVSAGVPYVIAKLACSVVVFLAWTFPAQRRLVFRHRPRLQPGMSVS
jgi:putative flippase GtrA